MEREIEKINKILTPDKSGRYYMGFIGTFACELPDALNRLKKMYPNDRKPCARLLWNLSHHKGSVTYEYYKPISNTSEWMKCDFAQGKARRLFDEINLSFFEKIYYLHKNKIYIFIFSIILIMTLILFKSHILNLLYQVSM